MYMHNLVSGAVLGTVSPKVGGSIPKHSRNIFQNFSLLLSSPSELGNNMNKLTVRCHLEDETHVPVL